MSKVLENAITAEKADCLEGYKKVYDDRGRRERDSDEMDFSDVDDM